MIVFEYMYEMMETFGPLMDAKAAEKKASTLDCEEPEHQDNNVRAFIDILNIVSSH